MANNPLNAHKNMQNASRNRRTSAIDKKNQSIDQKTITEARRNGMSTSDIQKIVNHAEKKDYVDNNIGKDMSTYHATLQKIKSRGKLDMGAEDVPTKEKSDALKERERIMNKYGIDENELDKQYAKYSYEQELKTAEKNRKESEQFAKDHPVLGSLKSIGTNLMSGLEGYANNTALGNEALQDMLVNQKTKHQRRYEKDERYRNSVGAELKQALLEGIKPLDETQRISADKDFLMSDSTQKLREGASSNINSNLGKKAYNVGMGVADQAAQFALSALMGGSPQVVGGLQGGQVANDMMKQSLQNGNSAAQAALTGLGSGAVTYGLSKWGADNIIDAATKGAAENWGAKNILNNTLKAMGTEGLEEGAENIIDNAIDQASAKLFKGTSNQEQMVRDYIAQGYDRETAEKYAKQDRWDEIKQDAISGALVGGLLSGAQYGSAKLSDRNANRIPRVNGEQVEYNKPINRYTEGAEQLESKTHNVPLLEDNGNNDGSVIYGQKNRPTGVDMQNRPLLGDNGNNDGSVVRLNDRTTEINPGVMYANEPKYSTLDERSLVNVRTEELLNAPIINGLNKVQTDRYRLFKERQNQGIATDKQLAFIDNVESNIFTQAYNEVQNGYGRNQEIDYDPNAQTIYDEVPKSQLDVNDDEYLRLRDEKNRLSGLRNETNKTYNKNHEIVYGDTVFEEYEKAKANGFDGSIYDFARISGNNIRNSSQELSGLNSQINNVDQRLEELYKNNFENRKSQANKVNGENINNNTNDAKVEKKIKPTPEEENVEYGNINLGGSQNTQQTTSNTKQTFNNSQQNVNVDDNVKPNVENTNNNNATGQTKERSYPQHVDIDEDFRNMIDAKYYKQLKNADTVKKANILYNESSSLEDAHLKFMEGIKSHDPASVVLGKRISDEYVARGDYDKAVAIMDDIAKHMTRAGQFTQAAYITALKNNPRAVAASIENDLRKINQEGRTKFGDKKWKDFELTDAEKKAFADLKDGDVEGINKLVDQVYSRMSEDFPHTKWEQLYDIAKHCMLLNPRTHIRNVAANAISMPVRSTSDRVKYALEGLYGRFVDKNYQRTSSKFGGTKEAKAIASKYFDDFVKDTIDDGGKWSQEGTGRLSKESQLYKDSKVGEKFNSATSATLNSLNRLTNGKMDKLISQYNESATNSVLENIKRLDYYLLGEVEDVPFVKQNFVNALSNIMTAQNINSAENISPEAVSLALDEALKATFKDDNAFTEALSTIKKKTGKFGDIVMPFTKTPANLAMRGLDYSPAGLAMTFKKAFDLKRNQVAEHIANGGTNAKDAKLTNEQISGIIGDLSKNLTGTGMIFLGYALAKAGLITGGYSDDKNEKNYQKLKGFQPNAFHVGNKYYTYDWAQPSSIPLLIGTSIYEGIKNDDKETNKAIQIAKSFKNGSVSAMDAWFNLSPLKGVSEIMGGGDNASYGENSIGTNVLSTIEEWPLAYIPSALGAATRASDPTIRNTFDKTSTVSTLKNQAMSKIPGLSKNLPASYDVWGRERKRSANTTDATIAQFVNPGTLGYDNPTNVDDFLMGIFDKTQDGKVFPRQAEYKVELSDGIKELNNKEYSERQKVQGQKSLELVQAYQNIAKGSDLNDEENIKVLSDLYSAAKAYTDNKLYGKEMNMSAKEREMFDKGPKAYAEYMRDKAMASRNDLSYDKYKTLIEEGGNKAIENYVADREATNEINAEVPDKEINVTTYQKYIEKGATKEDILFLQTMKSKADTDNSEELSKDEIMNYIGKQNMNNTQKSQMLSYVLPKQTLESAYVRAGLQTFGQSSLYTVLNHYKNANLDGKGTQPTKKEVQAYVNQTFKTQEERDQWYYVLYGASHQKKKK